MIYVSGQVFKEHSAALVEKFCASVAVFAQEKELPLLDRPALEQMSTPLEEVTREVLSFGLDIWPDSIREDVEQSELTARNRTKPAKSFMRSGPTLALIAACFAGTGTLAISGKHFLDFDGDGVITVADLHAAVDYASYGTLKHIKRRIVRDGVTKDVVISYTGEPGSPWEVESVTVHAGLPVKTNPSN